MSTPALIGSGFYTNEHDRQKKMQFQELWLKNVGMRDIVVVDNSDSPLREIDWPGYVRALRVFENAGHVGSYLGQNRPHLLGWSLSWIIPAWIAYAERRDFIYQEQDCLAFGNWEQHIMDEAKLHGWEACFGKADSNVAECEQSLFWIKSHFISEFIYKYLAIPEGDGLLLPESKFARMAQMDFRIGQFTLGFGRKRPLMFNKKMWYAQKFTEEEMGMLISKGFV